MIYSFDGGTKKTYEKMRPGRFKKNLFDEIYQNIKNLKVGDISKPILVGDVVVFIKKIEEKITDYNLEIIKRNVVEEEKMKKLEMISPNYMM